MEASDVLPECGAWPTVSGHLAFVIAKIRCLDGIKEFKGQAKPGHLPYLKFTARKLPTPTNYKYIHI